MTPRGGVAISRPLMVAAMPLSWFDYHLPRDRIAQCPAQPRDASRLMRVNRQQTSFEDRRFRDLPSLLRPGDLLVANRTQVLKARLMVRRPSGEEGELLLLRPEEGCLEEACCWEALGRPARRMKPGVELELPSGATVEVVARRDSTLVVRADRPLWKLMHDHGQVPLPPYIERPRGGHGQDSEDYQTVFAEEPGAVAAPTAGLHFTPELLSDLQAREIQWATLVLHVGPGTFRPVGPECAEDVRRHRMHPEWYRIPEETADSIRSARAAGRRVIAVGTTSVRALESWHRSNLLTDRSNLFIYPGFEFRVVDGIVTNFHLPRSTLLMMISAFAGREKTMSAYQAAVARGYRFYSFGDAMLLE